MTYKYRPKLGKPLTCMETAIMVRVVEKGETVRQVAKAIGRSPSTISSHLHRVRCKLGARSQEQAAVFFDRCRRSIPAASPLPGMG